MDERKGLARAAGEAVGAEGRNRGAGKGGLTGAFWALAAAQVVSLFGNAVLRFALPLHVLGVTGSSAVMGVVTACAWVPYIVLAPIGGVAADRIRKRLIMAALDAAMAAVCAAYLLLSGTADVVGLAVAALVALYAVQSIYQPTVQASVPALVGRAAIQRGTAVVSQGEHAFEPWWGRCSAGLLFGVFGIGPRVSRVSGILFAGVGCPGDGCGARAVRATAARCGELCARWRKISPAAPALPARGAPRHLPHDPALRRRSTSC